LAELFQKSRVTITEHIGNIFREGELSENSVCRKFRLTAADGKEYDNTIYNLDVIISVGYRVKSIRGTQFRIWATERLREYLIKGFTMNDDLLKKGVDILKNYLNVFAISAHRKKYFIGRFWKFMQQALIITPMWKPPNCFFKRYKTKK